MNSLYIAKRMNLFTSLTLWYLHIDQGTMPGNIKFGETSRY